MKALNKKANMKKTLGGLIDPKLPRDQRERNKYEMYGIGGALSGGALGALIGRAATNRSAGGTLTGSIVGAGVGKALSRRIASARIAHERIKEGKPLDTKEESDIKKQKYADILLSENPIISKIK